MRSQKKRSGKRERIGVKFHEKFPALVFHDSQDEREEEKRFFSPQLYYRLKNSK